jgi:hypothetical protein
MTPATLRATALLLTALLLTAAAAGAQAVRFVDHDALGAGDGTSWADAFLDLQSALDVAVAGDQVWIAEGTYRPSAETVPDEPRSASFVIADGVQLYGGFTGSETHVSQAAPLLHPTVLSGDIGNPEDSSDNAWHVVTIAPGAGPTTRLDGLVIRAGLANGTLSGSTSGDDNGAGVLMVDASLMMDRCILEASEARGSGAAMWTNGVVELNISRCTFRDNVTTVVGALVARGESTGVAYFGNFSMTDTVFHGNQAANGAGLYITALESALVERCRFEDNHALGAAAGLFLGSSGETIWRDCLFLGNAADSAGGGMLMTQGNGHALFDRCRFEGNSAQLGAGVHMQDAGDEFVSLDVTFLNTTFVDNHATSQGGGMRLNFASPLLVNCGFFGNTAAEGGGLAAVGGQAGFQVPGSDPKLRNVLFSGNAAERGAAIFLNAGSDPLIYNATISNNTASDAGGGLYLTQAGQIPTPNAPEPRLVNSILWGNSDAGGSDESAQIHIDVGLEVVNYCLVQGLTGALHGGVMNIDGDPLFADPDGADDVLGTPDDDYRLGAGSPAVDSGNNAPYLTLVTDVTDLDCDDDTAEPLALDLGMVVRFADDPASADAGGGSAPFVDRGALERGAWASADRGLAGLHGKPCLVGEGTLLDGDPVELRLTNALEGSTSSLFLGLSVLDFPGFYGGTLYPFPDFHFSGIPTDGAGQWTIASTWPSGVPSGFTVFMQVWVGDAAAPFGLSGTNGVAATAP